MRCPTGRGFNLRTRTAGWASERPIGGIEGGSAVWWEADASDSGLRRILECYIVFVTAVRRRLPGSWTDRKFGRECDAVRSEAVCPGRRRARPAPGPCKVARGEVGCARGEVETSARRRSDESGARLKLGVVRGTARYYLSPKPSEIRVGFWTTRLQRGTGAGGGIGVTVYARYDGLTGKRGSARIAENSGRPFRPGPLLLCSPSPSPHSGPPPGLSLLCRRRHLGSEQGRL